MIAKNSSNERETKRAKKGQLESLERSPFPEKLPEKEEGAQKGSSRLGKLCSGSALARSSLARLTLALSALSAKLGEGQREGILIVLMRRPPHGKARDDDQPNPD